MAASHPTWALGFQDEAWLGRLARPALRSWVEADRPLRLVEQAVAKEAPGPKALACYGLLLRAATADGGWQDETRRRFVDGRPVSAVTTESLARCCARLQAAGQEALLLAWDNASRHVSRAVRAWIRAHDRRVKWSGRGVRIIPRRLPIKSPWLNPIEPTWVLGTRRVVEPARLLPADELIDRVYAAFDCDHEPLLAIPAEAA